MPMDNKRLMQTLRAQHQELREILATISKEIGKKITNSRMCRDDLKLFRTKLTEHLTLEDNIFYPEVFKILEEQGRDIQKTKEFVNEMKIIGGKVFGVLDTYSSEVEIEKDFSTFTKKVQEMIEQILLRISTEEDGVYMYLY